MKTLEQVRAALEPYPVEVEFPAIGQWQAGNCGIEYVYSFDSGRPGPHVLVMALTHGNEVSGAIAVDRLLRQGVRPRRGWLSLAFGNVEAYQRFDPHDIDASRFLDEDMNRVWLPAVLDGGRDSVELRRARALRPLIDSVDLLLDIHSMHEESAPLMMCGPCAKGLAFARTLGVPATVVADAGHANGRRLRDYGGFGHATDSKNALLVETGQHVSKKSERVALDVTARFLIRSEIVAEADVLGFLSHEVPKTQQFLQVTEAVIANSMDFSFTADFRGLERIARAGTVIAYEGTREIVTPYDDCVLIQPSLRQLGKGVTMVRLARSLDG